MTEKLWFLPLLKKMNVLNHIYVLLFVLISFVIFDVSSLSEAFSSIAAMFGYQKLPLVTFDSLYYLNSYAIILIIAVIGATPFPRKLIRTLEANKYTSLLLTVGEPILLIFLLTLCTAFLIDGSFNPFLYFRF